MISVYFLVLSLNLYSEKNIENAAFEHSQVATLCRMGVFLLLNEGISGLVILYNVKSVEWSRDLRIATIHISIGIDAFYS